MRRTFKFRLYPNANQTRELGVMLETHRRLYNECLEERKTAWETEKKSVTFLDQRTRFIRTYRDHPFRSRLNANGAHQTIKRLDLAFQAFFRRVKAGQKPGYPRFKGRDRFGSIPFGTYPDGAKLIGSKVRVQYVGSIRVKLHREIQGKIKTVVLRREADKWFVTFSCDLGDAPITPSTNPSVGIDVGIESFLTTSDGDHEPSPSYLKTALPELRRRGRAVSRKRRGGKNRRKSVKRLAKCYARIKNLRKEHHHQTALKLVRRYGLVAVERLNIRGMMGNDRLARAIGDAAWGGFINILKCKAEGAGVQVVEVDPWGTSQECSGCGAVVPKGLSIRRHDCPNCSLSLDRDENAARNILSRALAAWIGPTGLNVGHQAVRAPRSPVVSSSPKTKRHRSRATDCGKAVYKAEKMTGQAPCNLPGFRQAQLVRTRPEGTT